MHHLRLAWAPCRARRAARAFDCGACAQRVPGPWTGTPRSLSPARLRLHVISHDKQQVCCGREARPVVATVINSMRRPGHVHRHLSVAAVAGRAPLRLARVRPSAVVTHAQPRHSMPPGPQQP